MSRNGSSCTAPLVLFLEGDPPPGGARLVCSDTPVFQFSVFSFRFRNWVCVRIQLNTHEENCVNEFGLGTGQNRTCTRQKRARNISCESPFVFPSNVKLFFNFPLAS